MYAQEPKDKALEIRMVGYHDKIPSFLKGWDFPAMSKFVVKAQKPLDNVTVHITFFVRDTPDFSLQQFQAVRCGVLWPERAKTLPHMLPIHSDKGLEFWVPHIDEHDSMTLRIGWPKKILGIRAAAMRVESDQHFVEKRWKHWALENQREKAQKDSRPFHEPEFGCVQLDQVCERLLPFEVPRKYLMAR